jgi:four helix bundle protein
MKYTRFEDLPVWQAGMVLAERVFRLTEDRAFTSKGDLRSQLQRAALSICNNVAEGFERGTTQELLTFLYIARGSAGEVRSMLLLAERMAAFAHLKSETSDLKSLAEGISRQLRAWADSLQNSDITGQRYLTDKTRRAAEHKKSAQTFFEKIDRLVEEGQKKRQAEP